ncbi:uncharacterized protein EMH_0009730 [Eimeria mitis]|uniref:Uncharacterized protein n=1 Tax=Eimeria mitis TaxID=44415 RepID=U6K1P9_9EIME|nr:uncharacterized protein EMH_0009730 [Eimeria mitis]CDJ31619.1 hypothetical protein, conserved [Eimeria mitis]
MKRDWKQWLLIAGGAAATGVALYYLLREEGPGRKENETDAKKFNKNEATKEQVMMVLRDILNTQEKMKGLMKKFTQKFVEEDYTFEEAYAMVARQHPEDPLSRYGLTMRNFDGLLDKFQHDPEVKRAVMSIVGATSTPT